MNHETMPIDFVVENLSASIVAEVQRESLAVDPQFFTMSDISRIISRSVDDRIASLDFARRMELLATIPGASDASPEMRTVRFSIGDHVVEVLRAELERRLLPLRYDLAFAHYEGRIVQIMAQAGELAAELIEGPARRCIKPDDLEAYREGVESMLAQATIPSDEHLDSMLCRGCGFFSPLDRCIERPEWGGPDGISEETVGYSALEVRSWFLMVADMQSMNKRRPVGFATALAEEISALPPPSP